MRGQVLGSALDVGSWVFLGRAGNANVSAGSLTGQSFVRYIQMDDRAINLTLSWTQLRLARFHILPDGVVELLLLPLGILSSHPGNRMLLVQHRHRLELHHQWVGLVVHDALVYPAPVRLDDADDFAELEPSRGSAAFITVLVNPVTRGRVKVEAFGEFSRLVWVPVAPRAVLGRHQGRYGRLGAEQLVQGACDGGPQCRMDCGVHARFFSRPGREVGRWRDGGIEKRGEVEGDEEDEAAWCRCVDMEIIALDDHGAQRRHGRRWPGRVVRHSLKL